MARGTAYSRMARLAALGEKVEQLVKGKPKGLPRKRRKKKEVEEKPKKKMKRAKQAPEPEEADDDELE